MSHLRQEPSPAIAEALRNRSIDPQSLIIFTATDIDPLGHYQRQWLAVTAERVMVIAESEQPEVRVDLTIGEAEEFRCHAAVGSGVLQARMDGMWVDLLRYSNRLASRFQRIARKLDRCLQGEPVVIHPEDEQDPRRCEKCGLMLEFEGDVCPRCVNRGAVLARMYRLMRPYRGMVLLTVFFLMVGIALDLVAPRLIQFLVDNVLPGSPEEAARIQAGPAGASENLRILMIVVGILAAVQCVRMIFSIINGRIGNQLGTEITYDIRGRMVSHLQQLSVAYYDRQQVGSLVGRVAYDTESLHGFILQLTGGFLAQILLVVGVGLMMFSINAKLALFTLIPAPLVIAGSIVFWRYIFPRYYRFWDASSKQAGTLSGILSGIRVVKAFSMEEREVKRFDRISRNLRDSRRRVDQSVAVFNPIMALVFQFGGWIVWFVGGRDVLAGEMTLGSLMAFFIYQGMFYGPLTMLTQFTNWLTQFVTQAQRIFEILDSPIEITDVKDPIRLDEIRGEIGFDDVSFGYNRNVPVIEDVSLKITPGEMIGIVGRSGSGKTTLINLISRFYDVDEGRVLIDGMDVRKIAKDDLRRQIGVVLQEPFLFRGSIRDNLAYGKPDTTPEAIIASSRAGNCHDFIMRRPHGYDTWVGERGAGLSGGERQRVSIARVLLIDPRILILDEATSSVDPESEASIQSALAEVVKGRTTIAIAHRLSTLRNADRILVVDRGKVVESGSHQELLDMNGVYARLVRIQGQIRPPSVDALTHEDEEEDDIPYHSGSPLPHPLSHHVRWLEPATAHIHLGNLGALHVTIQGEGIYRGVYALRCMPVHYPNEYISLRFLSPRKREIEVGLIRDLDQWPADSQRLIRESLLKSYFVHTIESIDTIQVYNGYLNFRVETDLGPADFMMRWQSDRAHDYGPRGKMLLDTEENRYLIPDMQALPEKERQLFERFIYW